MSLFRKTFHLLPIEYKRKSYLYVWLLLIASILETLGIGIILPLLELVISGEFSKNIIGINLKNLFQFISTEILIKYFLIFLVILYFTKSIFLIYFAFWQNKFSQNIFKNISERLFGIYLNTPINFFYARNSSELVRNVLLECKNYGSIITLFLKLITEIIISFFILLVIFLIEPFKTFIICSVLITLILLFYLLTKTKIYNLGLIRQQMSKQKIKVLQESFGGVKDIKLKTAENFFIGLYRSFLKKFVTAAYIQQTIIDSPRMIIEFLFIAILSFVLLIYLKENNNLIGLLPVIGLYVVASFRLIPGVMKILNLLQQIRGSKSTIEVLDDEFRNVKPNENYNEFSDQKINFNSGIKIENIYFAYDDKNYIINNFSLSIKKNDYTGIIGKSGSGKSTLIDLITGIILPNKGKILVDGLDIQKNIKDWQKKIGYVSQSIFLLDASIKENVAFGEEKKNIDNDRVKKALEEAKIFDYVNQLKDGIETVVGEKGLKLSGGQIQRIGIARELFRKPSILILDEATSGLDEITENELLECLEKIKYKTTILIVSHRNNTLKNCSKVIDLNKISKF